MYVISEKQAKFRPNLVTLALTGKFTSKVSITVHPKKYLSFPPPVSRLKKTWLPSVFGIGARVTR
jgi:hypothetical protein